MDELVTDGGGAVDSAGVSARFNTIGETPRNLQFARQLPLGQPNSASGLFHGAQWISQNPRVSLAPQTANVG
jgi:hypothetical protein